MKITKKAFEGIRDHCNRFQDIESCGYLFGKEVVEEIKEGINLDNNPISYTIDPETTLKSVFREDLMGVYHSHLGAPYPSGVDKEKPKHINKYYLIYSVFQDVLKAYFWNGKGFKEEGVEIV